MLYGSAFKSPTIFERNVDEVYVFHEASGNLDLIPEKIQQSEVSLEYEIGKRFHAKASYFYWETENEIQFDITAANLYVHAPDLSLIHPSMPAMPGLFYTPQLNVEHFLVSWTNNNSRIGHGPELEAMIIPNEYCKLKLNYSQVNLYSRQLMEFWSAGVAEVVNGILELHYQDLVFMNFYAHAAHTPVRLHDLITTAELAVANKWVRQFGLSLGGNYNNFNIVFSAFNLFNNVLEFDSATDDYLRGNPIYRVNAGYTLNF